MKLSWRGPVIVILVILVVFVELIVMQWRPA
jgi:hypothetical protein